MIIAAIIVITFCIMELIAWALHRYVMHGFLWKLHLDHHQPTSHSLQKNDFFFLLFAVPSTILIMNGISTQNTIQLGMEWNHC
jgi:Fatty acid hydroxylase superfamily.